MPAAQADVYAFLADLENHWRMAGRFVEVVELRGPVGARDGGRVRIRAPLGLRRTAVTEVVETREPEWLRGCAEVGRTQARVRWTLRPADGMTDVRLEAAVVRAGAVDRILLALGGRWWLRRRFRSTLEHLLAHFNSSPNG